MSPIGHTLTGLAIGYAVLPAEMPRREKIVPLAIFALLANAPDWPLPWWGHDRYDISHSIFTNLVAIALTLVAVRLAIPALLRPAPRYQCAGIGAWLSHLLLDTFYNSRLGLPMFWPVSYGRINLPVPFFEHMDRGNVVSYHNLRVALIEGVFYGTVLLLVMLAKRFTARPAKVLLPQPEEG